MRLWLSIFLLLILCVAVGFAGWYFSDPVTIQYQTHHISQSLWVVISVGILALLVLMLVLRLLGWLILLPVSIKKWNNHRQHKKTIHLFENALRAAVFRNKKDQYQTLSALADISNEAALRAAQVAQELGMTSEQNKWLQIAAKSGDATIAAAANAEICRLQHRLTEAHTILKSAGAPQSSVLLAELLYHTSSELQDWASAMEAAHHLQSAVPILWAHAVRTVLTQKIQSAKTADEVTAFWQNNVQGLYKKQVDFLAIYTKALWEMGKEEAAIQTLAKAIKAAPDSPTVLTLIADYGNEEMCQTAIDKLENLEKNQKTTDAPTDEALLLAMAKIYHRLKLSGKAKQSYQKLNALYPNIRYEKQLQSFSFEQ